MGEGRGQGSLMAIPSKMQMHEDPFFFKPSILSICTKDDITVEQQQLAFNYVIRNPESGDDGKEENNSMLILRIVAVKYPRKDGNVVIGEIFTKVMTPSANKRKCDFGEEARNIDNKADDSRRSDSLYDSNQPRVPGFVDWWMSTIVRWMHVVGFRY